MEVKNLKVKFYYFKEFKNGENNKISPMNTEPCRRYIQKKSGVQTESDDILYMFYHEEELESLNK